MDEPITDHVQGCHPAMPPAEVVVAVTTRRIVNELRLATAGQRALATDNLPRIPFREPGAHCPVPGCLWHTGPDDPPLAIPRQR